MYIGIGYILVSDIFCQQLGIHSYIGYILPTIGRYILVLDIFCPQLGGYILILDIFCQQLVDKCQLWGVFAPFGPRVTDCAFGKCFTRVCLRKSGIANQAHLRRHVNAATFSRAHIAGPRVCTVLGF